MNLQEIRQQYPQYNDMSDEDLVKGLHSKFYSDMDFGEFSKKVGYSEKQPSLVDQIPGLQPPAAPEPEQDLSWKHLVAPLETAASVGSGLTAGAFGGAVGGLQGILNSVLEGSFGTQKGLKTSENKMAEYANALTYEPRLEESKKMTEKVNKVLMEAAGPLASVMPQLETLATSRSLTNNFKKNKAAVEAEAALRKQMDEMRKQAPEAATVMPTQQTEMPFGYTPPEVQPNPSVMQSLLEKAKAEREGVFRDEVARSGQGDLVEGIPPYTKEQLLKKQQEAEALPFDGPGLADTPEPRATPQEALATNHTNPTMEFPLRQEVLESPEIAKAIEAFRTKDAELSQIVENAISEKVREKARVERDALRNEFGQGMEQLGIQNASDAYGRGLYESRGENTTGAVQHTFNPKNQRGAITAFVKERNFDKFQKAVRDMYPDATPEEINALWKSTANDIKTTETTAKINKGLAPRTTGDIPLETISMEDALGALSTSPDSKTTNTWYRKSFMPGGYMPAEFANNEGLRAGIRYLKSTIDKNARKAEVSLFESGTGIINSLTKLETLFGPGSASDLIKQMFQAKDNPEFKFNLDSKQQRVLDLINKQYDSMLQDINKYLPEGKQLEALPNYIPSIHDGKWYVEIVPAGSETGKPVLYGSHNKYALALKAKQLELQGHQVSVIKERGNLQNPKWKTNEFGDINEVKAANYQYMLDLLTDTDPAVQQLGNALSRDMESRAHNQAGVNQRMKEFHGFQGNLGNNPFKTDRQNYFDAKKAMINSVEAHYSWVSAQEAAQFHRQMIENNIPPNNRTILTDYIQGNVLGNSPKNVVDSLVSGVAESLLGSSEKQTARAMGRVGNVTVAALTAFGSPVHALQNVVQPLTVILPHLVKEGGGMTDLAAVVTKIPAEYLYVFAGKQVGEIAKLLGAEAVDILGSKNFNTKMKYALDTGIINPTIVEASPMFKSKLANRATDFTMQGMLSRPSEQAGRWAVFSSMYDLGIRKGLDPAKAAERAREITETYMVDYSPDAKPRFFSEGGLLGNTMGRLQTFASNQIAQTLLYLKNSKNSPKDAVAAMTYFATLATLGGIAGLPFFDLVEKIVNSLNSGDGETFSLRNKMRTSIGDAAVGGVWDAVGIGAAPSFASRTIGDNNVPAMLGFPTVGAFGKVVESGIRRADPRTSWNTETESEKGKEILSVTPVAARSLVEDKYLKPTVGGTKSNVSPETGRVLHKQQPGEVSFGNIRSAERAKDADINNQKFLEEQSLREQYKKQQKEVEKRITDIAVYSNPTDAKLDKFAEEVTKLVSMGADEKELKKILVESIVNANLGDAELSRLLKLIKHKPNLRNVNQLMKEVEYNELRQPQKGIFNFGVGKQ